MLPSARTYATWLALARIFAGAFWLSHGVPKFSDSAAFMPPNGFMTTFITASLAHTGGTYHTFLQNVVLPNIALFAELVRLGEVVAGALLVLGLFTRVGGLLATFLALNYLWAGGGVTHLSQWTTLPGLAAVFSALNLVLPTGRALGIDRLMTRTKTVAPAARVAPEFVPEKPLTGPTAPHD